MKNIDRDSLRVLTAKINAVLAALAEAEGLDIRVAGGSFTSQNATMKIAISTKGDGGVLNTREASALGGFGRYFGLEGVKLGDEVRIAGEAYTIAGLNTKARKTPVVIKRVRDGKTFRATAEQVRAALGLASPGAARVAS